MKRLLFACYFLVALVQTSLAQDKMEWTEGKKLTWNDFTARPDINSSHWAYTWYVLNYKYSWDGAGNITVEVKSYFQKDKSWKKVEKKLSPELLVHEQKHFDIAELFARKMRKSFTEYTATHKHNANTNKELSAIFDKLMAEVFKYQDLYDSETDHSKDEAKQAEWNKRITTELAELSKYKLN